jgi:murein DD-endopeptidase MepM/ murein hydrolase activator NlpD
MKPGNKSRKDNSFQNNFLHILNKYKFILLLLILLSSLFFSETSSNPELKIPSNAQGNELFKIFYERTGKEIKFYYINKNYYPFQFKIHITNLAYFDTNIEFPFYEITKVFNEKVLLFSIFAKSDRNPSFWLEIIDGDPDSKFDNYIYTLPFEHGKSFIVYQGYNTNYSHNGSASYAIDFSMPIGTPICAARDGYVIKVVDFNQKSGVSKYYSRFANYITIYHQDGTFASYVHLKYKGSLVKIGQYVKAGEQIGLSGNTGRTTGPHLHFQVNLPAYMGHKSIPVPFLDKNGNGFYIKPFITYTSFHIDYLSPEAFATFLVNISSGIRLIFDYTYQNHHIQPLDNEDYE